MSDMLSEQEAAELAFMGCPFSRSSLAKAVAMLDVTFGMHTYGWACYPDWHDRGVQRVQYGYMYGTEASRASGDDSSQLKSHCYDWMGLSGTRAMGKSNVLFGAVNGVPGRHSVFEHEALRLNGKAGKARVVNRTKVRGRIPEGVPGCFVFAGMYPMERMMQGLEVTSGKTVLEAIEDCYDALLEEASKWMRHE